MNKQNELSNQLNTIENTINDVNSLKSFNLNQFQDNHDKVLTQISNLKIEVNFIFIIFFSSTANIIFLSR